MAKTYRGRISRVKRVDSTLIRTFVALGLMLLLAPAILADDLESKNTKEEKKPKSGEKAEGASLGVKVKVSNFGKVTDFYYRGAQPKRTDYKQLAEIGVKTVIDLRHDPKDFARSGAEQSGLRYINFPMSDHDYPPADTAEKFLKLISNESLWPIYVHCAGGRHRTGVMTAVYRLTVEGWDIQRAYREMKEYDFYTRWGHGEMKEFIYDYYKILQEKRAALNGASPAAATDANGK